ncbi:MAG: mannosyltransferase family protein [Solirubrobacteraceae bacterium]
MWGIAADGTSWRGSFRLAALAFLSTRAVVWVVGMLAVHVAGLSNRADDFDRTGLTSGFGTFGDILVAPAARWDATWFLEIANDGYADTAHAAFFPLYPLLARAAGLVFGSALVGGILVSFAAGTVALAVLHRLAVLELGADAARAAVWLLACFPAAFFLSAVYSESLFLALSLGSVYAARTGRWGWAGTLGGMAALTRSAGVVLLVALAVLWWTHSERRPRDLLGLALLPAGLAAYCVGLALGGLDGLAPFDAQEQWFRHFAGPFVGAWDGTVAAWDGARQLLSGSRTPVYFEQAGGDPYVNAAHNLELFATLVVIVPMLVGALRRLPLAHGLYALAALALPLSYPVEPQPLMSLPRFALVLYPLFLWLGWWAARGRVRLPVLAALFLGLQALGAAEFATWHWVA